MGKAQSTEVGPKGSSRSVSHNPDGPSDAAKLRNQKAGKKGRNERPVSYHGPVPTDSQNIPVFNSKSATLQLTGRPQQSKEVSYYTHNSSVWYCIY